MKTIWRNFIKAFLLLSAGGVVYYALEVTDRALLASLLWGGDRIASEELPELEAPTAPDEPRQRGNREGNAWLGLAKEKLRDHQAFSAKVVQVGWSEGGLTESYGEYTQSGHDDRRSFSLTLQGRLADRPAKLRQVSDGTFVYTDLVWDPDTPQAGRSITRVDLRRVRRELSGKKRPSISSSEPDEPTPISARFWGLPMLLDSLDRHFDFGPGRRMELRGEEVVAMVGRWNQEKQTSLLNQDDVAIGAFFQRAPHHVVVALQRETLFPMLIEYRGAQDPIARGGLADESLLRPSRKPLLKIDLMNPVLGSPVAPERFVYAPPEGLAWVDRTDRELAIVKRRQQPQALANSPSDGPPR